PTAYARFARGLTTWLGSFGAISATLSVLLERRRGLITRRPHIAQGERYGSSKRRKNLGQDYNGTRTHRNWHGYIHYQSGQDNQGCAYVRLPLLPVTPNQRDLAAPMVRLAKRRRCPCGRNHHL